MKINNIKNLFLVVFGILFILSCSREEDDIFDKQSSVRTAEAKKEYKQILANASGGWLLEYYAGTNSSKIGGVNLFAKFSEDGTVIMSSEYYPTENVTSLYDVKAENSIVLSFSTYNKIIHMFADPLNGPTSYNGDFEFIFQEITADRIVLKGKKRGNLLVMTKYAESQDNWENYLDSVNTLVESTGIYSQFKIYSSGTEIGTANVDANGVYSFSIGDASFKENAIYTTTGIKFYQPLEFAGKTVRNFSWEESNITYSCTDQGSEVFTMIPYFAPTYLFYSDFIGTFTVTYNTSSTNKVTKDVTIEPNVQGSSFIIKGLTDFDVKATYNRGTGTLEILTQDVGTSEGYTVKLCPWDSKAGYLTTSTTVGFLSSRNVDYEGIQFTLVDNKVWLSYVVSGYLLRLYNGTTYIKYYGTTATNRGFDITLTKK